MLENFMERLFFGGWRVRGAGGMEWWAGGAEFQLVGGGHHRSSPAQTANENGGHGLRAGGGQTLDFTFDNTKKTKPKTQTPSNQSQRSNKQHPTEPQYHRGGLSPPPQTKTLASRSWPPSIAWMTSIVEVSRVAGPIFALFIWRPPSRDIAAARRRRCSGRPRITRPRPFASRA